MLREIFPSPVIVRNEVGRPVMVVPDEVMLGLARGISALEAAKVDLSELTVGVPFPVGEATIWEARAGERGAGKLFVQVELKGEDVVLVAAGCVRDVFDSNSGLITINVIHEELTSDQNARSLTIMVRVNGNPRNTLVKKYRVDGGTVMPTEKSREEFRLSNLFTKVFGKESEYLTLGEAISKLLGYVPATI